MFCPFLPPVDRWVGWVQIQYIGDECKQQLGKYAFAQWRLFASVEWLTLQVDNKYLITNTGAMPAIFCLFLHSCWRRGGWVGGSQVPQPTFSKSKFNTSPGTNLQTAGNWESVHCTQREGGGRGGSSQHSLSASTSPRLSLTQGWL